jgi:hypothetical protein
MASFVFTKRLIFVVHMVLSSAGQKLSVSGQSSGGSMAIQHLFAYSSRVEGAAIAAGSPYGCGARSMKWSTNWTGSCYWGGTNISDTIGYIQERFKAGLIDDPSNLKSTPVVVFNGKWDWVVYTADSQDVMTQLSHFVQAEKLTGKLDTWAAHVWSLDHPVNGSSCWCGRCGLYLLDKVKSPCCDVNNCGYDLSGDFLRRTYGTIKPRTKAHPAFLWVRQHKYLPLPTQHRYLWNNAGLEKWAIVYMPTGCRNNTAACRVHVNYHGCIADRWRQRKTWVSNLDLNEYGEANNIIIVYPQASGDKSVGNGCWNWANVDDDRFFDTQHSVQLSMVTNLVADLQNATNLAIELPAGVGPPATTEEDTDQNSVDYDEEDLRPVTV